MSTEEEGTAWEDATRNMTTIEYARLTRERQGLPPKVTDPDVIRRVAAILRAHIRAAEEGS